MSAAVENLVRRRHRRVTSLSMPSDSLAAAPSPRVTSRSLSSRLWDLKWKRVLPWVFEDVSVEPAGFEDVLPFVQENYARIFGTQSGEARFLSDPLTETKRRFGSEMDVFQFRAPEGVVGVLMSHPTDWTTYYMRTVAILPEYRERRLLTRFMERSYEPLRAAGVERIEGECSPANLPMMRMLVGQGFMMTSTANSERWGYVARFTKFLREEAEMTFLRQYCVVAPTRSPSESGRAPSMDSIQLNNPSTRRTL
jgi:hypothetical protein